MAPCGFCDCATGYDKEFCTWWEDPMKCLFTCCCSCFAAANAWSDIEKTDFNWLVCIGNWCCPLCGHCLLRKKVHEAYGITGESDVHMVLHSCCCALCQDYHEVGKRENKDYPYFLPSGSAATGGQAKPSE